MRRPRRERDRSARRRLSASAARRRRAAQPLCGGGACRSISPAVAAASALSSFAPAAAARPLPLLRLDAGLRRRHRVRRHAGVRYLHCSLCSTAWNHIRAICITCGESRSLALKGSRATAASSRPRPATTARPTPKCCMQARDTEVDPVADDLATLGLDLLVAEAGWSRHAPSPLLRNRARSRPFRHRMRALYGCAQAGGASFKACPSLFPS